MVEKEEGFIKWFSEIDLNDSEVVGTKGSFLGYLYNKKFPVPTGFVLSVKACDKLVSYCNTKKNLDFLIENQSSFDSSFIDKVLDNLKDFDLPKEIKEEILEAYFILGDSSFSNSEKSLSDDLLSNSSNHSFVSVKSSFINNNSNKMRFVPIFLNVFGPEELIEKVKECAVLSYALSKQQKERGFAIIVQQMIDAKKSGAVYSKHPFKPKALLIEATLGIEGGFFADMKEADRYSISDELEDLRMIESKIAEKNRAVNSSGDNIDVPASFRNTPVLSSYEIKKLGQYAKEFENLFNEPCVLSFAIDSEIKIIDVSPLEISQSQNSAEEEMKRNVNKEDSGEFSIENTIKSKTSDKINILDEEDIETIILRELEGDYNPSFEKLKEDIPPLTSLQEISSKEIENLEEQLKNEMEIGHKK